MMNPLAPPNYTGPETAAANPKQNEKITNTNSGALHSGEHGNGNSRAVPGSSTSPVRRNYIQQSELPLRRCQRHLQSQPPKAPATRLRLVELPNNAKSIRGVPEC